MKTPEEYAKLASENFAKGMNCSQAVACAFAEDIGLDRSIAAKIASSYGGGMGHLEEVCGALTGAFTVCGFKYGFDEKMAEESGNIGSLKEAQNVRIQKLAKDFTSSNKSYLCRDLLKSAGSDRRAYCKTLVEESAKNFATMLQEGK